MTVYGHREVCVFVMGVPVVPSGPLTLMSKLKINVQRSELYFSLTQPSVYGPRVVMKPCQSVLRT